MHRLLDEVGPPSPILESRGSSPLYSAVASETEIDVTNHGGRQRATAEETE